MKKVFYISLGFLVLVLIFLGAYNFAFKHNVNNPVAEPEQKQALEEAAKEESVPVVERFESPINEDVSGAVTGPDGKLYYYSLDDKALKRSTLEGKDKEVLLSDLPGTPIQILWSPKRGRVLLQLKLSDGRTLWHSTDLATKTLVPLRAEMSRLVWNNLGDKILYQYTDPTTGVRSLNMADPDGSAWKKLTDLGTKDSFIAVVPQSASVSFWGKPNALETASFETVGLTSGEGRKTLLSGKFGSDYLWSPAGNRALVSASNEKGGHALTLGVINANGGQLQDLFIPTLVSKIVWSQDGRTIYYALPGSLPETAVLPNDYFAQSLPAKDSFWKMDIESGKRTRLVELKDVTKSFDSEGLFLSQDEGVLFFTDRQTHRLYRIDL
jgi:Tol biopolymer transport system component